MGCVFDQSNLAEIFTTYSFFVPLQSGASFPSSATAHRWFSPPLFVLYHGTSFCGWRAKYSGWYFAKRWPEPVDSCEKRRCLTRLYEKCRQKDARRSVVEECSRVRLKTGFNGARWSTMLKLWKKELTKSSRELSYERILSKGKMVASCTVHCRLSGAWHYSHTTKRKP